MATIMAESSALVKNGTELNVSSTSLVKNGSEVVNVTTAFAKESPLVSTPLPSSIVFDK